MKGMSRKKFHPSRRKFLAASSLHTESRAPLSITSLLNRLYLVFVSLGVDSR
jgi:hypothetical protein